MLAEAAERQLPDLEQRPLEARYCTAQLTMASPLKVGQFHLDNNYLRGFDIHHDVLEFIGFKNDFQHVDTDTSRAFVADSTHLMAIHALPEQMLANAYRWASKIHGVDYSYLTYPASIELLQSLLGELKDECVAGSIQVTPNPAALSLGDSLKATVTVKSRADHVLISRRFIGAGVRANLRSDSTIIAPAPTNGTEIVPVLFSSTGAVLGHVSVTVPSVPFSGTVRQYLTKTWVGMTQRPAFRRIHHLPRLGMERPPIVARESERLPAHPGPIGRNDAAAVT
jgi:hypothetical protein